MPPDEPIANAAPAYRSCYRRAMEGPLDLWLYWAAPIALRREGPEIGVITIRAVRSVCYFVGSDRSPIQAGWPGRRAPDLPTVPDVTEAQLSRGAPFTSRVQKTHREACSPTPAIPPISRHRKAAHKTYRGCNRCITDINCYIHYAIRNYGDVFRDRIHGPSYRFHTHSAQIWGRSRDIDTESASPHLRKAGRRSNMVGTSTVL